MPGVSKAQIAQAKQIDLLTYLRRYEPNAIVKSGSDYRLKEHDSLVISDNGKWHWCSRGFGGKTALDFLIHVRGYAFLDAVHHLLEGRAVSGLPSQPVPPKVKKPFALPPANRCGFHSLAYLQSRGLDSDIIMRCINEGRLYESRYYANCVFVGFDPENIPRFAWVRGSTSGFRQDIEGSDKRYSFALPSPNPASRSLAVGESPIDVLSIATILKLGTGEWESMSYLSLGGTSPLALLQHLKDSPGIEQVSLCLDNDKAGLKAMQKIKDAVLADESMAGRLIDISIVPPPIGKDYNEALLMKLQEKREQTAPRRLTAAISI